MTVLGGILLLTAVVSVIVQGSGLIRLRRRSPRVGMVRTAWCRVIAAFLYIGIGVVSITRPHASGVVGVSVFIAVQFLWWGNSALDLRLSGRQPENRRTISNYQEVNQRGHTLE